ncbi:hypothetical protein IWW50_005899, partial [Coemansia erecta]
AEFSAKRALAQQRQSTRRTIAGDEVSRQKKQKHNIMYLAHQAQEQEDTLRERHANRQQAKKAAKAKYASARSTRSDKAGVLTVHIVHM